MLTFTPLQYSLLILSLLCFLLSVFIFLKGKEKLSLLLLLSGALGIRLFVISLDPFLHDWDERFHALVAKNMIEHPLTPMLYVNPVLPYSYQDWWNNHIWLHKPPLFLWFMAASMKIFGTNEIALRLPSVLLSTIQIYFIYRIGELLKNRTVGFFAGLFTALSYYQLQLVGGHDMDHMQIVFCFFMSASIWAYAEYQNSKRKKWMVWIGVFSGCAVLTMWLPGLVIYGGWGTIWLVDSKFEMSKMTNQKSDFLDLLKSLLIAVIIFLPWQLYTFCKFPLEARNEMEYNNRHITEALDGHEGPWYYYLQHIPWSFGMAGWILLPLGLYCLIRFSTNKRLHIVLLFSLFTFYFFFSFAVKTKMNSNVYAVSPVLWIAAGSLLEYLFSVMKFLKKNSMALAVSSFILVVLMFAGILQLQNVLSDGMLQSQVGNDTTYRTKKTHNTSIFRNLNSLVPEGYVVFNVAPNENIEAMFYSNHTVYTSFPNEQQINKLKSEGIKIAAFESHGDYRIPDFALNDTSILIIHNELK